MSETTTFTPAPAANPKGNSLTELMAAFSTPDRPVKAAEYQAFWKSCTEEQKAWYKAQPLN